MADITMCSGIGCDRRDTCKRFNAEKSTRQSWFLNPPVDIKTQECEMYWKEESINNIPVVNKNINSNL